MKLTNLWAGSVFSLFCLITFSACDQSDPPPATTISKLNWSGRNWNVKSSETLTGPGLNLFSNDSRDIYVDTENNLHLKISKRNGNWYSSEIVSNDVTGYGEYKWTVLSDFNTFDPYTVLGLFTWDNYLDQANTEIDIEMARWGQAGDTSNVQFTVQPSNNGQNNERVLRGKVNSTGPTTHVFRWKEKSIEWVSFQGTDTSGKAYCRFKYYKNAIPRTKTVGGQTSSPVTVPIATGGTNVRLNFWTMGSEFNRQPGPSNGLSAEVVLSKFSYFPY